GAALGGTPPGCDRLVGEPRGLVLGAPPKPPQTGQDHYERQTAPPLTTDAKEPDTYWRIRPSTRRSSLPPESQRSPGLDRSPPNAEPGSPTRPVGRRRQPHRSAHPARS